ncbi:hypothetical protein H8B06_17380 [Sphingobacterium sp. DN00404]|uniref:Uncharacterized protein n=1 Tax=Sphingobacterium micropteri TaxID=2763501 RepID=A0ABR7YTQ3_9SPHI|nr:hypothetical protein [Sphingobacterium micropteri]
MNKIKQLPVWKLFLCFWLIAIIFLHNRVLVLLKDYDGQRRKGIDTVFDSSKYNFRNMDFWNRKK